MYLNAYQKYFEELIEEYESLLLSQLLRAVNIKFGTELPDITGYAKQMCEFGCYKMTAYGSEFIFHRKDVSPNFDMMRSFEVLLSFLSQQVIWHRRSKAPITIRFFLSTLEHDKEIFIISVQQGKERTVSEYVNDKFDDEKCIVVIFLLEAEEQMQKITATCNFRFALITKDGVVFYKKE